MDKDKLIFFFNSCINFITKIYNCELYSCDIVILECTKIFIVFYYVTVKFVEKIF